MTDMTIHDPSSISALTRAELRDFFDRLAAGDYHQLAKELSISSRPTFHPRIIPEDVSSHAADADSEEDEDQGQDPDASVLSIDSLDSFRFQPTAEGLHRAVSLIRGEDRRGGQATPEEEEAFQFTFRLMIHKLYSINDFARMVEDVVRTSRDIYRPLAPEYKQRTRRQSSFSFASSVHDRFAGDDSFTSTLLHSPASPSGSSTFLPSTPSSSTVDRLPVYVGTGRLEDTSVDERAVKKRIVGRKLTVAANAADERSIGTPGWVYESVGSPTGAYFDMPLSPAAGSPSRSGYAGHTDDGEYTSRKRRFSFLAARGF